MCAKGFTQEAGRDYDEIFSPVVRYDSLRVLLAIAAQEDLEFGQFDAKTAFLQGDLKEDIYMRIPKGLNADDTGQVCKLNKPLYGLKQSSQCWNHKLNGFLESHGLKRSQADACVYSADFNGAKIYLALYADDGLIFATTKEALDMIISKLAKSFEITVGDATSFVGMELVRDRVKHTIFIHQRPYVEAILSRFGMNKAQPSGVPIDCHTNLGLVSEVVDVPYREAVGCLMFLGMVTRPDIAYAISVVSRFLSNHRDEHWNAVKRIYRFLIGTIVRGILYGQVEATPLLSGYSDADFAGDMDTRRSTTGCIFMLCGGAVTWAARRQRMVCLSTTEAEYVAASEAVREAVWLRQLLSDVGHLHASPTTIFVDNQSPIKLAKNPEFHRRTKYIDVRCHFIREKLKANEIRLVYVNTNEQLADIFTKPLNHKPFKKLSAGIGLVTKSEESA